MLLLFILLLFKTTNILRRRSHTKDFDTKLINRKHFHMHVLFMHMMQS